MVTAYQFVKFREENFTEFHLELSKKGIYTCFDLDDNVIDFKNINTNMYKEIYRQKLTELMSLSDINMNSEMFCFCINDVGSFRYYEDIETLKKLDKLKIACIFLTKVNDVGDIKRFLVDSESLNFKEFIPIIENNNGFNSIENILSFKHDKFKKFAFGHCDYNLSCNIFPFVDHHNERYWEWIEKFAAKAKKHNKSFINSPYLNLADNSGFIKMLDKTATYFDKWGQVCFNTKQSFLCADYPSNRDKYKASAQENEAIENSKKHAKEIVDFFEKNNHEGRGFSISSDKSRFISPQEYVLAKRFLYDMGKG